MEGFILKIDEDYLKKLEAADGNIKGLADSAEETQKKVDAAFKELASNNGGLEEFIKKLTEAQRAMGGIKAPDLSVSTKGLGELSSQAALTADDVNKLIIALSELSDDQILDIASRRQSAEYERQKSLVQDINRETRESNREKQKQEQLDREANVIAIEESRRRTAEEKQATREIKEQRKTAAEQVVADEKRKQDAIKRTLASEREFAKQFKSIPQTITTKQVGNIVAQGIQASSINQKIVAIKNLQAALKNLDTTSSKYVQTATKIKKEIEILKNELSDLGEEFEQNKKSGDDAFSSIKNWIIGITSISAIKGFIGNLISVRKEFELQERSLAILLSSYGQAEVLWKQITDLAVKSPFRVGELISYTKQLAAYRIESDKLFDTTRRLADVSAGLGVDMQRLILAYGQVRAANFLRGTELRQFTEAGIPLLEELARHFSALEGQVVTTGDVFSRISDRLVSFKDVAKVFDDMTSSGGIFYKMQEQQADTLYGQISNLHDRIDLMLNSIGEQNQGIINTAVAAGSAIVSNYKLIATAVKLASIAFIAHKAIILETAIARRIHIQTLIAERMQMKLSTLMTMKLTKAIRAMFLVLKSNPWSAALSAILLFGSTIYDFFANSNKELSETEKQIQQINQQATKIKFDFFSSKDITDKREQLLKLISLVNREYRMNIKVDVQGLSEEEINKQFTKVSSYIAKANNLMKNVMAMLPESLDKEMESISAQMDIWSNNIVNSQQEGLVYIKENLQKLPQEIAAFSDMLTLKPRDGENTLDYYNRLKNVYNSLAVEIGNFYKAYERGDANFKNSVKQQKKAVDELSEKMGMTFGTGLGGNTMFTSPLATLESFVNQYKDKIGDVVEFVSGQLKGLTDEDKKVHLTALLNTLQAKKSYSDLATYILENELESTLNVNVNLKDNGGEVLSKWQRTFNTKFAKTAGFKEITDAQITQLELADQLNNKLSSLEKTYEAMGRAGKDAYAGKNRGQIKSQMEGLSEMIRWLGVEPGKSKKGRGQGKDWWAELAKDLKDAHQEFNNLNKDLAKSRAMELTRQKFEAVIKTAMGAVKGLKSFQIQWERIGEEDYLKSLLTDLVKKVPKAATSSKLSIEKALAEITGTIEVKASKESLQKTEQSIKSIFDEYELTISLNKQGIPDSFIRDIFGIEPKTIRQLFEETQDKFLNTYGRDAGQWSEEVKKAWDKLNKDLTEAQNKNYKESIERYTKYLIQAKTKQVQIQLEGVTQIQDIYRNFIPTDKRLEELGVKGGFALRKGIIDAFATRGATGINESLFKSLGIYDNKTKNKVLSYVQSLQSSINEAVAGVKKETAAKLQKQAWEDFKTSDMYENMFRDLTTIGTKSIDMLIGRIQEIKNAWKDASPTEVKAMVEQIQKLEDIKIERAPFAEVRKIKTDLKNANAENAKQQQLNLINAQNNIDKINEELDLMDLIKLKLVDFNNLTSEQNTIYNRIKNEINDEFNHTNDYASALDKVIDKKKKEKKEQEDIASKSQINLSKQQQLIKGYQKQIAAIQSMQDKADEAFNSIRSLMSALGKDMDGSEGAFLDISQILVDSTLQFIQLQIQMKLLEAEAEVLGVTLNSALGVIGWASIALSAVTSALSVLLGVKDKKIQKKIDDIQKNVDKLQRSYDNLSEAVDEAFNLNDLQQYGWMQQNITNSMIRNYQEMIKLEQSKKHADEDKIREYEEAIEDLQKTAQEANEKLVSIATDGVLDNVRDAAKSFTDAWLESFNEVGSGMDGLKDQMNDIALSIIKQQASMLITSTYIDRWKKNLEKYINPNDLQLTAYEAEKWVSSISKDLPSLNNALEAYMKAMKSAGIDLTGGEGGMSGLQMGIQNITESTGEEIAAYASSLRFLAAERNEMLTLIANSLGAMGVESPIVTQLRLIGANTAAINTLLNSLVAPHPTMAGRGLKVII